MNVSNLHEIVSSFLHQLNIESAWRIHLPISCCTFMNFPLRWFLIFRALDLWLHVFAIPCLFQTINIQDMNFKYSNDVPDRLCIYVIKAIVAGPWLSACKLGRAISLQFPGWDKFSHTIPVTWTWVSSMSENNVVHFATNNVVHFTFKLTQWAKTRRSINN